MSETVKSWLGPTGATFFWVVVAAIVGVAYGVGDYHGSGSSSLTAMTTRQAADEATNTAAIASVRQDMTNAVSGLRSEDASARSTLQASLTDRMDRSDADLAHERVTLYARLAQDESDTKAAAQFVNSVDLRLTRMEAQLDLVVKNITTTGARR